VNFWPSLTYLHRHGDSPMVQRSPLDADTYGLRIAQLLMPVTGHRLAWIARAKDPVNVQLRTNEGDDASLGVVGGLGFLALLVRLVLPTREPPGTPSSRAGLLDDLSAINLAALLLATVGGFGLLVALTATSKIRAYNRISAYIAFMALFAVVVWLDALYRRYGRTRLRQDFLVIGLATLAVLAILDQTSARTLSDYARTARDYRIDHAFVRKIDTTLPEGAAVFQLPVVPFPEHPPVFRMQDYDHARGYLHASRLRWSYGAMKGRADEAWQAWAVARPFPSFIDTLVAAGFSGLYVNRDGHADWGVRVAAETANLLGQPPLTSRDQRLLFFDLRPYAARLRSAAAPAEWSAKQEAARHPLLMIWQNGCSHLEGTPQDNFRWCADAGEWHLINSSPRARRVTLEMSFTSNHPGTLRLESPLLSERWRVGPVGRTVSVSRALSIPPGEHRIPFSCDALRVLAAGDRRHLVFKVDNFRLVEQAPD
jgi:phosphoglycerol transferase